MLKMLFVLVALAVSVSGCTGLQASWSNSTESFVDFKTDSLAKNRPVFDLFLFNTELDLLELRLTELDQVVDFFVLFEQPITSSGYSKQLHYQLHKDTRFAKWASKIITVNGSVPLSVTDSWEREHASRVMLLDAVKAMGHPEALILFSDVDEIPSAHAISVLKNSAAMPSNTFVHNVMPLFYYSYRWKCNKEFSNMKIFTLSYLDMYPNPLEQLFFESKLPHLILKKAGWHCSYCMSPEEIQLKLISFAHKEFSKKPYTYLKYIKYQISKGRDLFRRSGRFMFNQNPEDIPPSVVAHPDKFGMFFP